MKRKSTHILGKAGKVLGIILGSLIVLLLLIFLLIQIPAVQTYLGQRLTGYLSNRLDTEISVERVDIDFFKTIVLEDVYVEDLQDDTLLYANNLQADIGVFNFFEKEFFLNYVSLNNAKLNISRAQGEEKFNYEFIIDEFARPQQPAEPWVFGMDEVELSNVRFNYNDYPGGTLTDISVNSLQGNFRSLGLESWPMEIEEVNADGARVVVRDLHSETAVAEQAEVETEKGPFRLVVDNAVFTNSLFSYDDEQAAHTNQGIDWSHFAFEDLDGRFEGVNIAPEEEKYIGDIYDLSLLESSGFLLQDYTGNVNVTLPSVNVRVDELVTRESRIQDRLNVNIENVEGVEDDLGLITFDGRFRNSVVSVNELSYFAPDIEENEVLRDKTIELSGIAEGQLDDAVFRDFYVGIDDENQVRGDFVIRGLPDVNSLFFDADISRLETRASTITAFTGNVENVDIEALGHIIAQGTARGTVRDFTTDMIINTSIGQVQPDMAMRFGEDFGFLSADGLIRATEFDVGRLMETEGLGIVSLTSTLDISGNENGEPDINSLVFDADIRRLETQGEAIASLVGEDVEDINLAALGDITVQGTAAGTVRDFTTDMEINTSIGVIEPDLAVRLGEDFDFLAADGTLSTDNFNIGQFLDVEDLETVTMTATVNASGDNLESFEGEVSSLVYNNYTYNGLSFEGDMDGDILRVDLDADDENLAADVLVELDLSAEPLEYDIEGQLENVNLLALNLTEEPISLEGQVDVTGRGTNLNQLRGEALVRDFYLTIGEDRIPMDSLYASISMEDNIRSILVQSPFLQADISGQFRFTQLPQAFEYMVSQYYSVVQAEKPAGVDNLSFDIHMDQSHGLIQLFVPAVQEVEGLDLTGFYESETEQLDILLMVDRLSFEDYAVTDIRVDMIGDGDQLLAEAVSNSVRISENIVFEQPVFRARVQDDRLVFDLQFADTASATNLALDGVMETEQDTFYLDILNADINLEGNAWRLSDDANIVFSDDYLSIDDFTLSAAPDQQITVSTTNIARDMARVSGDFQNVQVGELLRLFGLDYNIRGSMDGQALVVNPLGENQAVETDLVISDLTIDERNAGVLELSANKSLEGERLQLTGTLLGESTDVNAEGYIGIGGDVNEVNLVLSADRFNTAILNPFLEGVLYDLSGQASAFARVQGTMESPQIEGNINLTGEHTIGVSSTQTVYQLYDETITLTSSAVRFEQLEIFDNAGNRAVVRGTVIHDNLEDFYFDLNVSADNFLVMNNSNMEELPFYGRVAADLDLQVVGPGEDLVVNGTIRTREGTNVYTTLVPATEAFGPPDYINFVGGDTTQADEEEQQQRSYQVDLQNISLDATVVVTPDATLNMIVDPSTGDEITARGSGTFGIGFETTGDLNIYGTYLIEEGTYTFGFLDLVTRELSIEEGSTVSFYGNPENGTMNITATYTTEASREPLIQDQIQQLQENELAAARRQLPVTVYLFIQGDFEGPDISFDIEVPEATGGLALSLVNERLNQIENTPSELNKQVLGLLAFNQFMPYGGWQLQGGSGGAGIAAESVSGFLNQQLAQLTNQIGGIQLDVNLDAGRTSLVDNVNVMASTEITDRLRVSVGGQVYTGGGSTSGGGPFLGDYVVTYSLNESGSFMLKMFQTSERNLYTERVDNVSGASVQLNRNFDSLRGLFRSDDNEEETQEQQTENLEVNEAGPN